MTLAEFRDALDAHGADVAAWPAVLRAAAERLLADEPAARASFDAAARMDALIRHSLQERTVSAAATAAAEAAHQVVRRVAQNLPRQRRSILPWPAALLRFDLAPARLRIAALVAVAGLGVLLGLFGPDLDAASGGSQAAAQTESVLATLLDPEPITGLRP
jgi:hypothetical protein